MAYFDSMNGLLMALGLPRSAPWSMYASSEHDCHPLVYLGANALALKADEGCFALALPRPAAPRLQVMVDKRTDPTGHLFYEDRFSRVEVIDGPRSISLFGLPASLSTARFASKRMDWPPEEVPLLRVHAGNELFARRVIDQGVHPHFVVGVTDGCNVGGNDGWCVNQLLERPDRAADALSLGAAWWVTDHFEDAIPDVELQVGTIVKSRNPGYPLQFRAVASLSETWGHYGQKWGLGATWLFHVEPAI